MITGAQVKEARALLGWSAEELADRAALGKKTLELFEAGQENLASLHLTVLYDVLGSAGVDFGRPDRPGVRLRK
jgi:transcriptional regulator with XRE-family HTH domain